MHSMPRRNASSGLIGVSMGKWRNGDDGGMFAVETTDEMTIALLLIVVGRGSDSDGGLICICCMFDEDDVGSA